MRKPISGTAFWLVAAAIAFGADLSRPNLRPSSDPTSERVGEPQSSPVRTLSLAAQVDSTKREGQRKPEGKPSEVHRFFDSLRSALHKGDEKLLGSLFTANARHIHHMTGRKTEGRDAIQSMYREVFDSGHVKAIDLEVEDVRQVSPDVAAVQVHVSVQPAEGPPVQTKLDTLVVKRDGKWQIDSVSESPAPTPAHPYEALQNLAWLVGDWKDQDGDLEVATHCTWNDNYSFLNRSFVVSQNGKKLHEGTQRIGFDAVDGVIRSWTFESDGSFGEGYWNFDGKRWTVKLRGRTAAGLNVAATQIITPLDKDSYTTQLVGRELGGKLLPNSPVVKVVRISK